MAPMAELNKELYETLAGKIIYGKLFPLILEDFPTRGDIKMALMSGNLQVQVAIPAGTGSVTAAVYNTSFAGPESQITKAKQKAIVEAGGIPERVLGQ